MSNLTDTTSSRLTSSMSAASTSVVPGARPTASPTLSRRSTPPPKLNLDAFKPLISTTATNTSTNAASNPSKAFVFTSSRTLRSLHNQPPQSKLSPVLDKGESSSSSPANPPSPGSSSSGLKRSSQRPTLSPAQLARHSTGAVDARCIVSPNMRAAGFVPLYNQHSDGAAPSTSSPSAVPTPINPPRFPPIVFVSPNSVASSPMWEYQRQLSYGLTAEYHAAADVASKRAADPPHRPGTRPLQAQERVGAIAASQSSLSAVPSSSASSLFSRTNSPSSSLTSFELSPRKSPEAYQSIFERLGSSMDVRGSVDGYPFPQTPPVSRSHSKDVSQLITKSPAMSSSTASGSITPLAASPMSPPSSLSPPPPSSGSGSTPSGRDSISSMPSRPNPSPLQSNVHQRSDSQLSITQLCETDPTAWFAQGSLLPQTTAPARAGSTSGDSGATEERRADPFGSGHGGDTEEGRRAAMQELRKAIEQVVFVEESSASEGGKDESRDEDEDSIAKEKRQEKHRGREREKHTDRDRGKKREHRHHKDKASVKSHSSSSPTSSTPSPSGKGKGRAHHKKDRTRSTKDKTLSSLYTPTFATANLPSSSRPRPHTLGDRDFAMERERAREARAFAKDGAFARRERDREHARQTGHGRQKKDVAAAAPPPGTFSMAYDSGRGRGSTRGHFHHTSIRGRSVSSSFSVASEARTMVDAEESLEVAEVPA